MPKKRSNPASGSYKIGYGRPPQQYNFKRGQITNPNGVNQHTARSYCSIHSLRKASLKVIRNTEVMPAGRSL